MRPPSYTIVLNRKIRQWIVVRATADDLSNPFIRCQTLEDALQDAEKMNADRLARQRIVS